MSNLIEAARLFWAKKRDEEIFKIERILKTHWRVNDTWIVDLSRNRVSQDYWDG